MIISNQLYFGFILCICLSYKLYAHEKDKHNTYYKITNIFDDKLLKCHLDINDKYSKNYNRINKLRSCVKTLKECLCQYLEYKYSSCKGKGS